MSKSPINAMVAVPLLAVSQLAFSVDCLVYQTAVPGRIEDGSNSMENRALEHTVVLRFGGFKTNEIEFLMLPPAVGTGRFAVNGSPAGSGTSPSTGAFRIPNVPNGVAAGVGDYTVTPPWAAMVSPFGGAGVGTGQPPAAAMASVVAGAGEYVASAPSAAKAGSGVLGALGPPRSPGAPESPGIQEKFPEAGHLVIMSNSAFFGDLNSQTEAARVKEIVDAAIDFGSFSLIQNSAIGLELHAKNGTLNALFAGANGPVRQFSVTEGLVRFVLGNEGNSLEGDIALRAVDKANNGSTQLQYEGTFTGKYAKTVDC